MRHLLTLEDSLPKLLLGANHWIFSSTMQVTCCVARMQIDRNQSIRYCRSGRAKVRNDGGWQRAHISGAAMALCLSVERLVESGSIDWIYF